MSAPLLPPDALVGSNIGSYRVERRIGSGGMGEVYELVQPQIGKRLAAKVLHAEFALRPEVTTRFFDEARAVNAIAHPGIVDIIDHGELEDGRPYLLMELLDGESGAELISKRGALSLAQIKEIAIGILEVLQAVHRRGIVHRDLKPENIFVGDDGRVVLLDFGIAKLGTAIRSGQVPTRTGELLGTPRYMAPEQASGRVRHIDGRTDIYAMGAVLYEMLTGRPPFDSETLPELIEDQLSRTPVPVAEIRRDAPPSWSRIVARAMAKRPSDRFPSAEAMASAVAAADSAGIMTAGPSDVTIAATDDRPTRLLPQATRRLRPDELPTELQRPRRPEPPGRLGLTLPLLGLALAATIVAALLLF